MTEEVAGQEIATTPVKPLDLRWLGWWSLLGALAFLRIFMLRYLPAGNGADTAGYLLGHDFVNDWTGARMALADNVPNIFSVVPYMKEMQRLLWVNEPFHNFSYPPHILPLIIVFGLLPYFPALAAWITSGLMALHASVFLNTHLQRHKKQIMFLLLTSPAAIINIVLGQNGFFTAALFLAGLYLSERRPILAGVLIGMLTVKPQLGILIPLVLLVRRNWKCFGSAAVTTVTLVLIATLLWGIEPWENFWRVTVPLQVSLINQYHGFYIYMMPAIYTSALASPNPGVVAKAVWMMLHIVAALWASFVCLRAVKREGITARSIFLVSIATILVPAYCFNYDMMLVCGALLGYVATREKFEIHEYLILGLAWSLPTSTIALKLAGLSPAPGVILLAAIAVVLHHVAKAVDVSAPAVI